MLMKAKDLTGYIFKSLDGEIGKVKEFFFDDRYWIVRYLVADTGSWLNSRRVLISPYSLLDVNKTEKQISVDLTKKQIEESPPLNTDNPVSLQYETSYYDYYGLPVYWGSSYAWGNSSILVRDPEKRQTSNVGGKEWNPYLRSTLGVNGYHIQAQDGEIGHVKDFIIDDETWNINYFVVDTKNWLQGKTVLISPKWIERVSWDEMKVFVNLTCEAISESPEYSEKSQLTREYENLIHVHYNREGYWKEK